jgi:hypothetical protein
VKTLNLIANRHRGEVACVYGGGPTAQAEFARIAHEVTLHVSCNDHGSRARGFPEDYIVAMDERDTATGAPMATRLRRWSQAPIIAPWPYADYFLSEYPGRPAALLTGVVALWVAAQLGAKRVYAAGFDFYNGNDACRRQWFELFEPLLGEGVTFLGGSPTRESEAA